MPNKFGTESDPPTDDDGRPWPPEPHQSTTPKPATKGIAGDISAASAKVPQPAVGRLSLYFRELHRLLDGGENQINSTDLGRLVNVSPAVVRRDLSSLGTIGRRGVGYSIPVLIDRIGMMLGTGVQWRVILIGVGSLGNALLKYRGFERLGFEMMAAYDVDAARIGETVGGVEVREANQLTSRPETAEAGSCHHRGSGGKGVRSRPIAARGRHRRHFEFCPDDAQAARIGRCRQRRPGERATTTRFFCPEAKCPQRALVGRQHPNPVLLLKLLFRASRSPAKIRAHPRYPVV